jgi:hypothetical protein
MRAIFSDIWHFQLYFNKLIQLFIIIKIRTNINGIRTIFIIKSIHPLSRFDKIINSRYPVCSQTGVGTCPRNSNWHNGTRGNDGNDWIWTFVERSLLRLLIQIYSDWWVGYACWRGDKVARGSWVFQFLVDLGAHL